MGEFEGKTLLVLGGGYASYPIVKIAKNEGAYVIVADYFETGIAKEIADEALLISTTDMEALSKIVKEKQVDGVFCGPSEFNIVNVMTLCEMNSLPFYATREQWDICSDKALFKDMCRKHNVPCVPEYNITEEFAKEDLQNIKYPVVVKPVDSSSSRGISVANNDNELKNAYFYAKGFSKKGHVIVEKYINNEMAFSVKYVAYNGEIKLLINSDSYVVDPIEKKALISNLTVFPSKLNSLYQNKINSNVIAMFKDLGIKNGAFFMQALVDKDDGEIYFHEMGLRLSGGFTYTVTEPTTGISDAKMMLRYALGLGFSTPDEFSRVDSTLNGKTAVSLCYPLKAGRIAKITGIEDCKNNLKTVAFIQYYHEGDEITEKNIGTLDQHFCRIKLVLDDYSELEPSINYVMNHLKVVDINGNDMLYKKFDVNRLR